MESIKWCGVTDGLDLGEIAYMSLQVHRILGQKVIVNINNSVCSYSENLLGICIISLVTEH